MNPVSSRPPADQPSAEHAATRIARDYYNSSDADEFYSQVWGGEDIHVGFYHTRSDSIKQASRRTVEYLIERLTTPDADAGEPESCPVRLGPPAHVLDIGSGYGGAARRLVEKFGCRVTCVNVSETENHRNRELNKSAGMEERIEVVDGSFESLPSPPETFDFAWSQDAILHAGDRRLVLSEVDRVMKPGGRFVFTDPMQSDHCPAGVLDAILARIHLVDFGSPGFYRTVAKELGWMDLGFENHTAQLVNHYTRVLEATEAMEDELVKTISQDYLAHMKAGLRRWIEGGEQSQLTWGVFLFAKPK